MKWSEESLKKFGQGIQKVIDGQNLERAESYSMFKDLLRGQQPDLHQGAYLAALVTKGETVSEIAGAWEAIVELDTVQVKENFPNPLVENSGTGMDQLKTFNVSSAAAIVAAAGGVQIARHCARALTSVCGAVDILEAIGIDVECDVEITVNSIKKAGIGIFNGMSPKIHPNGLFRILSQIRFGSTLNIAASLASPCRPTHALRGVYSENIIPKLAEVMREINYRRALIVHGFDALEQNGMDELSLLGKSVIHEFFPDGQSDTYTITPEELGLKRAEYSKIAALNNIQEESIRFLKVLNGNGYPECIDFTCMNAGAILYLIGKVDDLKSGVQLSRELIANGQAFLKLREWIKFQSKTSVEGYKKFDQLIQKYIE